MSIKAAKVAAFSAARDYSKDNRATQEIMLDIMASVDAFRVGYGGYGDAVIGLYRDGLLPERLVADLIMRGVGVEVKRLAQHPALAERARAMNPQYDRVVEERTARFRKQFAEDQAKRAAKPPTPKEIERRKRHDEIMEAGRSAWAEIEAALSFYHSFKLSDGTKLVHATKEKLAAEFEMEASKALKHSNNAAFYKAILAKMPKNPKATVGQSVTAEDISVIRQNTFKEAAR